MIKIFNQYCLFLIFLCSCDCKPHGNIIKIDKQPNVEPDYADITIPPNISPLNFIIRDKGSAFYVKFLIGTEKIMEISSKNGNIKISEKKWKKTLSQNSGQDLKLEIYVKNNRGQWSQFNTIINNIAKEPIDPFLSYRLLYPGYEAYTDLSIKQRCIESFKEHSLIENSIIDGNCINCHTNNPENQDDYLFHVRGALGGTYFYTEGELKRINLKTNEMKNNATYPRWHPSGKFVAFSSNKTAQFFHSTDNKKVEVIDISSSLVLYDVEKNEITQIDFAHKDKFMDTYPEWSPDGMFLYFCRAEQLGEEYNYKEIKYNLFRVSFDVSTRSFGNPELVFDASKLNKSVSFPRISQNGKFLVLTLHDYGCFPIWHKEADLYSIDLEKAILNRLELNSDFTESYHSWSSNSKWLVFSSKREDGLSAIPFIAYIDENGHARKPFVLPQKDPEFYQHFLKTYNLPEFSTRRISLNPGEIRKIAKGKAIQAK